MKNIKFLILSMILSILLAGCSKNENAFKVTSGNVTSVVSSYDFEENFEKYYKNYYQEVNHNRRKSIPLWELRKEYAAVAISDLLLNSAIQNNRITVSENEIKAKENKLMNFYGSQEQYKKMLANQGLEQQEINEIFKYEIQLDKLSAKISSNKVSNSEIENFYKENKEMFNLDERVRLHQILIKNNDENLINDLIKKLETNIYDFAKLAKKYSQDEKTAKFGGDMGFVTRNDLPNDIAEEIFLQKVNTISKPLISEEGTHIFYVTDKAAKVSYPLEKVKNDIEVYLYNEKRRKSLNTLVQNLKKSASIEYFDKTLHPNYIAPKAAISKLLNKDKN